MPGRSSTSRLRSKTSDLSDLLRGSRTEAKQSETHLAPPVPQLPEAETQAKGKRIIPFLGRRRKSSSVSPSPSASRKSADKTHQDVEVPPLPRDDDNRLSTGHVAVARASASSLSSPPSSSTTRLSDLPSSLPPLNVSSPSFGSVSQFMPPKSQSRANHITQTPDPSKPASAIPRSTLRQLRPQKSTSFEFSRRSNDSQATAGSGTRPVITVSAPPPNVEEDKNIYTTPRSAPTPPAPHSAPARRHFGFRRGLRQSADSSGSTPSSPTSLGTPQSPMHFPFPPSIDPARTQGSTPVSKESVSREHAEHPGEDQPVSRKSVSAPSRPTEATTPLGRVSKNRLQKHASAIPLTLSKPKQEKTTSLAIAPGRTAKVNPPEPNIGPSQSVSDSALAPSHPTAIPSRIPASSSSFRPGPGKLPPPLLTTFRRPRNSPPTNPLPSTPASVTLKAPAEGEPILSALPTISSFASVSSRKSSQSLHQNVLLSRKNTVSSLASSVSAVSKGDTSTDMPPSPIEEKEQQEEPPSPRTPIMERADENTAGEVATAEQLREALNTLSAKYARLSSYLIATAEQHAAEKNELTRHIQVLEREARKREREITGLRWLVMNANQGGDSANNVNGDVTSRPHPTGCTRIEAKSSQTAHGRRTLDTGKGMSIDSNSGSTEEGLFELQKSVSDLIAPLVPSPPTAPAIVSPVTGSGPGRLRRSNTLPDGYTQHPVRSVKQSRRTSTPLLFATSTTPTTSPCNGADAATGLGLDFEMPSIPSLPGSDTGHVTRTSTISSLPSLTAVNTASSGLSVIHELPRRPHDCVEDVSSERVTMETREKGERRASRAPKRISASSTSSSVSASASYSANLKASSSPSIGQVLAAATGTDRNMDSIMQKLRAFGSG
ncbi:hypothetical protein AcV5_009596 [Taiwanofungus camphoratus]|nr:hypothetical protein AcV5_009596 [Antrodia cinnamomea]KAI0942974.1 hypothetical protein AcV7_002247 [Antrodia cinnamomea]